MIDFPDTALLPSDFDRPAALPALLGGIANKRCQLAQLNLSIDRP
jgi:hypothetical protein